MNKEKYLAACLSILLLAMSPSAQAVTAGNVQFVNGKVYISNATTQSRNLQKGDPVLENDTVTTSQDSSAQIKMRDGGLIAIRPDSKFKIDSFIFGGSEDGSERSFFSLIRGGIRAITGMIGQKNKSTYRIATSTATIAIRGTDHETYVVTADSPLAKLAAPGTYNKVNQGETALITDKGSVSILPNQMGFVGATDQVPQLQPVNLNLFTATPAPLAKGKGNNPDMRSAAVVDNSVQNQGNPGEYSPSSPQVKTPVTGRSGGPTSPALVF